MIYSTIDNNIESRGHTRKCQYQALMIRDSGESLRGDVERSEWFPDIIVGCYKERDECYLMQGLNGQPRIKESCECPILAKAQKRE